MRKPEHPEKTPNWLGENMPGFNPESSWGSNHCATVPPDIRKSQMQLYIPLQKTCFLLILSKMRDPQSIAESLTSDKATWSDFLSWDGRPAAANCLSTSATWTFDLYLSLTIYFTDWNLQTKCPKRTCFSEAHKGKVIGKGVIEALASRGMSEDRQVIAGQTQ